MDILHNCRKSHKLTEELTSRLRQFEDNYFLCGYGDKMFSIPPVKYHKHNISLEVKDDTNLVISLSTFDGHESYCYHRIEVKNFSHIGLYASADMIEFFSNDFQNNVRLAFLLESDYKEEVKRMKKHIAVERERAMCYCQSSLLELDVAKSLSQMY